MAGADEQQAGRREARDVERFDSLADCLPIIKPLGAGTRRCPHCQGERLYRYGVVHGLRRYRCRECGASFNTLTLYPMRPFHFIAFRLGR